MKMGFLFSGLFWGIVIILIGVSIIVRVAFNIEIPVFRIVMGLVLIYFGLSVLTGRGGCTTKQGKGDAVFTSRTIEAGGETKLRKTYSTVFGSMNLDLSGVTLEKEQTKVKIDTVFGDTKVYLNPDHAITIKGDAVFGKASFPDDSTVSFGSHTYTNEVSGATNTLVIKGDVVFGNLEFRYK